MGHPLSFPLLCVINLAVYQHSLSLYADRFPDRAAVVRIARRAVLVNGDDMLFKADPALFGIFMGVASSAGFQASQGKNYISADCCMINSQVFIRRSGEMVRKGYLNLKLVFGSSLKTGDSNAVPTQIARDVSEMVALTPWCACAVPESFSRFSDQWLGRFRPNWYLPVHLGGYGMPVSPEVRETLSITRQQRLMAARFVADPRLSLYRMTGMPLSFVDLASSVLNWRMVWGDYVQEESESSHLRDLWLERLAFAGRAVYGSRGECSDGAVSRRFRPEHRLKPMSREGIMRHWTVQLFATHPPLCPPLLGIRAGGVSSLASSI